MSPAHHIAVSASPNFGRQDAFTTPDEAPDVLEDGTLKDGMTTRLLMDDDDAQNMGWGNGSLLRSSRRTPVHTGRASVASNLLPTLDFEATKFRSTGMDLMQGMTTELLADSQSLHTGRRVSKSLPSKPLEAHGPTGRDVATPGLLADTTGASTSVAPHVPSFEPKTAAERGGHRSRSPAVKPRVADVSPVPASPPVGMPTRARSASMADVKPGNGAPLMRSSPHPRRSPRLVAKSPIAPSPMAALTPRTRAAARATAKALEMMATDHGAPTTSTSRPGLQQLLMDDTLDDFSVPPEPMAVEQEAPVTMPFSGT